MIKLCYSITVKLSDQPGESEKEICALLLRKMINNKQLQTSFNLENV